MDPSTSMNEPRNIRILAAAALLGLAGCSTTDFMPHGHCYLWNPPLVGLHVGSDILIGVSYVLISSLFVYFVRKRKDLPFDWMFLCFGMFIVACGMGHFAEVVTLWVPVYWISGSVKAFTALVSVLTAIL